MVCASDRKVGHYQSTSVKMVCGQFGLKGLSLLLVVTLASSQSNSSECITGLLSAEDFQSVPEVRYLERLSSREVLVPQMKFNCHGFITRWHAQLVNDISFSLGHIIFFHVWRPSNNSDGRFSIVGSNIFDTEPQNSNTRLPMVNSTVGYFSFSKTPAESEFVNDQIFFQPGDILGWFFSSSSFNGRHPPLGVVFRMATNEDNPDVPADMHIRHTNSELCDTSDCAGDVQTLQSVIPYVSVEYETVNPSAVSPSTYFGCTPSSFSSCTLALTTSPAASTASPAASTATLPALTASPVAVTTSTMPFTTSPVGSTTAVTTSLLALTTSPTPLTTSPTSLTTSPTLTTSPATINTARLPVLVVSVVLLTYLNCVA